MNRRDFIKSTAIIGIGLALPAAVFKKETTAWFQYGKHSWYFFPVKSWHIVKQDSYIPNVTKWFKDGSFDTTYRVLDADFIVVDTGSEPFNNELRKNARFGNLEFEGQRFTNKFVMVDGTKLNFYSVNAPQLRWESVKND